MAVHTFKEYSESINRFSPEYNDEVCARVGRMQPLMDRILMSLQNQFMILDMLKAYAFYGKPLHECLEVQMPNSGDIAPRHAQFLHGLLGLLTEVNELYVGANQNGMHGVNGIEEGGDLLWFTNEVLKPFQATMAEAAAVNEAKLSTRYGSAHDAGKAITRDKAKEKAAMEQALLEVRAVTEPASSPQSEATPTVSYTVRVFEWATTTFGRAVATDIHERCCRFLEESLELVQANGLDKSEAVQLVEYVFNRQEGDINQEVGGVLTTLHTLCAALRIDPSEAGEKELERCWSLQEKIRAKHNAKPKVSPLPGPSVSGPPFQKEREQYQSLLLASLPALEDSCKHNASVSMRQTVARIREILGLPPKPFKHGVNVDASGNPTVTEGMGRDSGN